MALLGVLTLEDRRNCSEIPSAKFNTLNVTPMVEMVNLIRSAREPEFLPILHG
jgi:hypothetical protein